MKTVSLRLNGGHPARCRWRSNAAVGAARGPRPRRRSSGVGRLLRRLHSRRRRGGGEVVSGAGEGRPRQGRHDDRRRRPEREAPPASGGVRGTGGLSAASAARNDHECLRPPSRDAEGRRSRSARGSKTTFTTAPPVERIVEAVEQLPAARRRAMQTTPQPSPHRRFSSGTVLPSRGRHRASRRDQL